MLTLQPVPADAPVHPWGHDPHVHTFGQLVHAVSGRATFTIHPAGAGRATTYVVDTTAALWIPPRVIHSARFEPGFSPSVHALDLGAERVDPCQFVVDDTVRTELLSTQWIPDPTLVATRAALEASHVGPLSGPPRPHGPLAGRMAEILDADPSDSRSLEEWARDLHTSAMTIRRAFSAETGMTYSQWRTHHRLHAALRLLREGGRPLRVAHAVGYSEGGLVTAFRRQFGCTPSSLLSTDRSV